MSATFGDVVERLRRLTVQVRVAGVNAVRGGGGSGVIWSADGTIVTNAHVVEGAGSTDSWEVELWDGRVFPSSIVRKNARRDLASLRVDAVNLPTAAIGDAGALRVGELVIAVGNPLGFIGAASTGVVHSIDQRSLHRSWVVSRLRLAPGNSGGPLANARGEVVGINTMILQRAAAGTLAFAVPTQAVIRFLQSPLGHTSTEGDTALGVVVRPIIVDRSTNQLGLMVLEVTPHSPADRASLLQGDILLGARGTRFQSLEDLANEILASRGGILELQFRRGESASVRTVAVQMSSKAARAA